jgi:hypothetical protein
MWSSTSTPPYLFMTWLEPTSILSFDKKEHGTGLLTLTCPCSALHFPPASYNFKRTSFSPLNHGTTICTVSCDITRICISSHFAVVFGASLPAALGPGVYSASNRNECRKHKKKCFWGVKCGWCVGLTTLLPSMSWLSRQCGILNISQPYRPPRPVTGIALLFFFFCFYLG